MKVLIIGGKSSLGVELKKKMSSYNEVITAGRRECDLYLDLSLPLDSNFDIECDVVVLTAAKFGGDDLSSFEDNVNINVVGTVRAIKLAKCLNAKHFILISSMSATQDFNSPYYGIYSITKRHSEEVAEFVCNSIKMPLTILRPSQLYGESESFEKHQPLIYNIINSVINNKEIIFYGKNNAIRNYLHIEDFNEIICRVIDLKMEGKFDCVNTQSTTLIEVAQAAITAFKSKSIYKFDNSKNDIIDNSFKADNLFYKKIDFQPKINIETGMRMIAYSKGII
jgi:nucleoside-diphosphate-sugar epimerase